jgi:hypothetical protein
LAASLVPCKGSRLHFPCFSLSLSASGLTVHTHCFSVYHQKCIIFLFSWSDASSKDLSNPCPPSVQGSRHFCLAAYLGGVGATSSACRGRCRLSLSPLQLLCSLLPDSRKQWPAEVFMVTGFRRIQWPDPLYAAVHHLLPRLPLSLSLSLSLIDSQRHSHKEPLPM